MIEAAKRRVRAVVGVLVVPTIMLLCVAVYWADAAGLSAEALSFPLALTAVLVVASAATVIAALVSASRDGTDDVQRKEESGGAVTLSIKTWMIVLLPIPLIYFWRELGAIAVFFLYSVCVLFFLGERRWPWLFVLPSCLAIGLVYLFKVGLYVRLPDLPSVFGG
jgi:cell division protein FtsW (lipid II flippase)